MLRHSITHPATADHDLSVGRIGVLAALYPAAHGLGQLYTGGLSNRTGRKPLIAGGMLVQAIPLAAMAAVTGFWAWAAGALLLGIGTAMVYPTLLADLVSVQAATYAVAALTALSGLVVIARMYETHSGSPDHPAPWSGGGDCGAYVESGGAPGGERRCRDTGEYGDQGHDGKAGGGNGEGGDAFFGEAAHEGPTEEGADAEAEGGAERSF